MVKSTPKGAFTPDANEALSASDLHVKSMQRRDEAICANDAARIEHFRRLMRVTS